MTTQSLLSSSSPSARRGRAALAPGTVRPLRVRASDVTPSAPSRRISSAPTPPAPTMPARGAGQPAAARWAPRARAQAQRQLARGREHERDDVLGHRPCAHALGRRPGALPVDHAGFDPGVDARPRTAAPSGCRGCSSRPSSGGSSPLQISASALSTGPTSPPAPSMASAMSGRSMGAIATRGAFTTPPGIRRRACTAPASSPRRPHRRCAPAPPRRSRCPGPGLVGRAA